jgi:hypothetical protein
VELLLHHVQPVQTVTSANKVQQPHLLMVHIVVILISFALVETYNGQLVVQVNIQAMVPHVVLVLLEVSVHQELLLKAALQVTLQAEEQLAVHLVHLVQLQLEVPVQRLQLLDNGLLQAKQLLFHAHLGIHALVVL